MAKTHKKGLSISKVEIDNTNNIVVYSDTGKQLKSQDHRELLFVITSQIIT